MKGIYVYIIRKGFVEEKWKTFLKISALISDKILLHKVFTYAVGEQVKFFRDNFLWICWKSNIHKS